MIIATDINGKPIREGDTVIDYDNQEHVIEWGKYKQPYGGLGFVYGYLIPDGARLKEDEEPKPM